MEKNNFVLTSEQAVECFRKFNLYASVWEVQPVKLSRINEKSKTELLIACWRLSGQGGDKFLRMDTGILVERPKHCACSGIIPGEGLVYEDGNVLTLTYFSMREGRIEFELCYIKNYDYHRIIVPEGENI